MSSVKLPPPPTPDPPLAMTFHFQVPRILAVVVWIAVHPASAAEKTHAWFRFTPLVLRDDANADSVQLSEIEFRLGNDVIDLSSATITNPGGDSPTGEEVENIADQDTGSKWLDFNRSPVVIQFPSAVTMDRYRLATANDVSERDPVQWKLEGSDDGGTWVLLDQRDAYPVPIARETYTGVITIGATPELAIQSFSSGETVVLNGASTSLAWEVFNSEGVEIQPAPGVVAETGSSTVTPPADADTTYTLTATRDGDELSAQVTLRAVQGGSVSFRYVRFTPVELRDNASTDCIQLAEFAFYQNASPLTVATVSNPGGNNPSFEMPANVIDGNTGTKWLDFNKGGLVFDFGASTAFNRYQLTTANDEEARDPLRWTLEGSADGVSWTLIENMTTFDFPTPFARETPTQVIPLPGASLRPLAPFRILSSGFDFNTGKLALDFTSRENHSYRVATSPDLSDWSTVLASGIAGADGEDHTLIEVDFTPGTKAFFRVEEE